MKKLLIIAALLIASVSAFSQTLSIGGSFTFKAAPVFYTSLDTVTDAGTKTYTANVPNRWQSVTLQGNMLKLTGTTSAVTIKWYGAVCPSGGTPSWVLLYTDTMADASTTVSHTFVGNPYTDYRAVVTGSGTQTSSYRIFALLR